MEKWQVRGPRGDEGGFFSDSWKGFMCTATVFKRHGFEECIAFTVFLGVMREVGWKGSIETGHH